MENYCTLDQLTPGQSALVVGLTGPTDQQRRLAELGFVPGSTVTALLTSPWGDLTAYAVCGAAIALRRSGAHRIQINRGAHRAP